ncbi:MAG: uncharacterized membrane protein YbhN (UPF0104 family) [Myxococcota bacterium]|jgi:uncharacterized membrane protein YbhN (UPF0104 family)
MTKSANRQTGGTGFVSGVVLSYLLAFGLIATLIEKAGIWNVLANTRVLDFAIEVGIVRYHDLNMGLVDGVADQKYYLQSQDPIDYRILLLAVGIYLLYWVTRAWKFHLTGRFVGLSGDRSSHMRARLMGLGIARFVPFRFGEAKTEAMLVEAGEDADTVRRTFAFDSYLTLVFQIALFSFIGLLITDFDVWLSQGLWAFGICLVTYYVARAAGLVPWRRGELRSGLVGSSKAMAERPAAAARLGGLSALTMLLDDITPFLLAMAFTADHVIMNVPFTVIQVGVVAGYIATRFQLTPLGIGQREWAFALALYAGGVGFPEAATIALLDSALRHSTGFLVHMFVRYRTGPATVRTSDTYFARVPTEHVAKPVPVAAGGEA